MPNVNDGPSGVAERGGAVLKTLAVVAFAVFLGGSLYLTYSLNAEITKLRSSAAESEKQLHALSRSVQNLEAHSEQELKKIGSKSQELETQVDAVANALLKATSKFSPDVAEALKSHSAAVADLRKELTEATLKRSDIYGNLNDRGSTADGYLRIRDLLICWGRKTIQPLPSTKPGEDNSNARPFEFTFSQAFDGTPTVANAILTKSSADSFAVYNYKISSTRYFGSVINHPPGQRTMAEVTFEYIAIGRAKQ